MPKGELARADAHNESEGHGALATIEAGFVVFAVGISMTSEMGAAMKAHVEVVQAPLAAWDATGAR